MTYLQLPMLQLTHNHDSIHVLLICTAFFQLLLNLFLRLSTKLFLKHSLIFLLHFLPASVIISPTSASPTKPRLIVIRKIAYVTLRLFSYNHLLQLTDQNLNICVSEYIINLFRHIRPRKTVKPCAYRWHSNLCNTIL